MRNPASVLPNPIAAHAAPADAEATTNPPGVVQGASGAFLPGSADRARSSLRDMLPPRDAPAAVIENMIYEHLDGPARTALGADAIKEIHGAVQSRQPGTRTARGGVGQIERADDGSFSVKCGEDLWDARSADEVRLHLLLEQHFDAVTGNVAPSGHDVQPDRGNPGKSEQSQAEEAVLGPHPAAEEEAAQPHAASSQMPPFITSAQLADALGEIKACQTSSQSPQPATDNTCTGKASLPIAADVEFCLRPATPGLAAARPLTRNYSTGDGFVPPVPVLNIGHAIALDGRLSSWGNDVLNMTSLVYGPGLTSAALTKTHVKQTISGDNLNCWWRSAWFAIFKQVSPEQLNKRLQDELPHTLQSGICNVVSMARAVQAGEYATVLTPDGRYRSVANAGNAGPNVETPAGESYLKELTFAILMQRMGEINRSREVHNAQARSSGGPIQAMLSREDLHASVFGDTDGELDYIETLTQTLGVDCVAIFNHVNGATHRGVQASLHPASPLRDLPMFDIANLDPCEQPAACQANLINFQEAMRLNNIPMINHWGNNEGGHFDAWH